MNIGANDVLVVEEVDYERKAKVTLVDRDMGDVLLEEGKCYEVEFLPAGARSRLKSGRVQVLEIRREPYEGHEGFRRIKVTTNSRPWRDGGTGILYADQIRGAEEIERGPHDR